MVGENFSISTVELLKVAGAVFTALVAMWGIRKVIKLTNRS